MVLYFTSFLSLLIFHLIIPFWRLKLDNMMTDYYAYWVKWVKKNQTSKHLLLNRKYHQIHNSTRVQFFFSRTSRGLFSKSYFFMLSIPLCLLIILLVYNVMCIIMFMLLYTGCDTWVAWICLTRCRRKKKFTNWHSRLRSYNLNNIATFMAYFKIWKIMQMVTPEKQNQRQFSWIALKIFLSSINYSELMT